MSIPILGKIFDKSSDIIDHAKKILNEQPKLAEKLEQAGGFVSLIGVGIELYNDIKESLKTEEEKAFGALLKISFESANETLDETNRKYFKGAEFERLGRDFKKKDVMESLLDAFEKTSKRDSYLPEHPSIREFRRIIISYLKERGVDSETINNFVLRFNLRIEEKAGSNEEFKKFYQWWTLEKQYSALKKYLEYVKNNMYYLKGLDKKPLYEYYVWHEAVVASADTWNWNEGRFYEDEGYKNKIQDIREIIRDFLSSGEENWYLVVGASFGIGKTSMVRRIASLYSSSYLNPIEEEKNGIEGERDYFIPVLVFLKRGLNNVHGQKNLNDVLFDVASSASPYEENKQAQQRPILLILDGLDEYRDQDQVKIEHLINDTLNKIHENYRHNMKVIITTRLKAGFPEVLNIGDSYTGSDAITNTYVRLLPFTEPQVNLFFRNYDAPLTYKTVSTFGLHHDEITKPLFAWMLSLIYIDPEYKIEFPENWSSRRVKSFIYMLFLHYVIAGKYRQALQTDKWKHSYINEKGILRQIAALKQSGSGDLNLAEIKRLGKLEAINSDLEPILTSYFYVRTDTVRGKVIDFVHETFKEYLLAEYYIESLLEDRVYSLNVGTPSLETIEFLYGLLELLKEVKDGGNNNGQNNITNIERYLVSDETSLLGSFNKRNKRDEAINQLISSAAKCAETEDIFLTKRKNIIETPEDWIQVQINSDDFKNFWIHRWISLSILKILDYSKNIDREKLVNLITYSGGNWIPYYVKNLAHANLSEANLSEANLKGADLSASDLVETHLTGANLKGANLKGANLVRSNIGTDVSGATLFRANDANPRGLT